MSCGYAPESRKYVRPGQPFKAVMPHSEVMIHMGMAGQEAELAIMPATITGQDVMIMRCGVAAGRVSLGEAGIFTDGRSFWVHSDNGMPAVSGHARKVPVH